MSSEPPTFPLLIKPACCDCNLRCAYCFYLPKQALFGAGPHRMTRDTLEATLLNLARIPMKSYAFYWQGGEPTLMGLDFYREAVRLQKALLPQNTPVYNAIQTNGTLLDKSWARFLKQNRFDVGVSLDGHPRLHDDNRRSAFGKPTFERVANNIRLLVEGGVNVSILTVVTHGLAAFSLETYHAARSLGASSLHCIPCIDLAPDGSRSPYSLLPGDWAGFYIPLFRRWLADAGTNVPRLVLADAIRAVHQNQPPPLCDMAASCQQYLVIEHNGDAYPCDFHVEPPWRLGNVLSDGILDLALSPQMRLFGARKTRQLPQECTACPCLAYCANGCPRQRDANGKSMLCEDNRRIVQEVLNSLAPSQAMQAEPCEG